MQDDTAWLAAQSAAEAQRPRLRGFGAGAGGGGGGAAALDVGAAEALVERVLQALDSLYTADAASIEESPHPNPHPHPHPHPRPRPHPHPTPHPTPEQARRTGCSPAHWVLGAEQVAVDSREILASARDEATTTGQP